MDKRRALTLTQCVLLPGGLVAVCLLFGLRFLLRRFGLFKCRRHGPHPHPPHPGPPGPHPPYPFPHHHNHHPYLRAHVPLPPTPQTSIPEGVEVPLILADDLQYEKEQACESKA